MAGEFNLKQLKEEFGELETKLSERKKQQRESGEIWNDEQIQEFESDLQRRNEVKAQIRTEEALLQMDEFESAPATKKRQMIPQFTTKQKLNTLSEEEQDLAVRSMCLNVMGMEGEITDDMRDVIERSGLNLRSQRIVGTFRGGVSQGGKYFRAQNTDGSANLGANTINESIAAGIEKVLVDSGGMLEACKIYPTEEGTDRHWTIYDDSTNEADKYAQNTDTTNDSILFSKKVIKVASYKSGIFPVSREMVMDSAFPIMDHITEAVGDRLYNKTNSALTNGDGSGDNCQGIVTAASTGYTIDGTAAADEDLNYSDLVHLEHSISSKYRKNSVFMMNDSVLEHLKLLTDSTTGRPLWVPSLSVNAPATLLGYRYIVNNDMPELGTASKSVVMFGDFSKYIVRRARNVEVRTLYERFALENALGVIGWMRLGGGLLTTAAVKALKTPSS